MTPNEYLYDRTVRNPNALTIFPSQSGTSVTTRKALQSAQRQGLPNVAVTQNPNQYMSCLLYTSNLLRSEASIYSGDAELYQRSGGRWQRPPADPGLTAGFIKSAEGLPVCRPLWKGLSLIHISFLSLVYLDVKLFHRLILPCSVSVYASFDKTFRNNQADGQENQAVSGFQRRDGMDRKQVS